MITFKSLKVVLLLLILSSSVSFSQTIINYETWTGAAGCNIFSNPNNSSAVINVPALINGSTGTIPHYTAIGQPGYDNPNKTVNLDSRITGGSQNEGTEYRLTVNFKQGYSYKITIIAARIMSTQTGANVLLRLDLNNGGTGSNNQCNGTGIIDANGSGNFKLSTQISNSGFASPAAATYVFDYNSLSSAQNYLMVAAIPPASSVLQTILIRKITITETPPTPTFTISPASLSIPCGSAITQAFTVNNVYNSPGTLSYDWNLGSASNGWIYNGNPAPQTFSTTANSINLTSSTTAASISNVAVTVKLNNANYATLTSNITVTAPANNYSIALPASRCSTGVFSVTNLPAGATVSWQATPANIVTFSNSGVGNPVSFSAGDGYCTVNAVVSINQCQVQLSAGNSYYGKYPTTATHKVSSGNNVVSSSLNYVPPSQIITFELNNIGAIPGGYSIQKVYGNSPINVFGNTATFSLGNYSQTYPANGTITLVTTVNTTCGNVTQAYNFTSQGQCGSCGSLFTISPNPANDVLNIDETANNGVAVKTSTIEAIKITDKMGSIVYSNKGISKNAGSKITIPISQLKSDVYTLSIFNGIEWKAYKIMVKH